MFTLHFLYSEIYLVTLNFLRQRWGRMAECTAYCRTSKTDLHNLAWGIWVTLSVATFMLTWSKLHITMGSNIFWRRIPYFCNILLIFIFIMFSGKSQFPKIESHGKLYITSVLPSKVMSYLFWLAAPLMGSTIVRISNKKGFWQDINNKKHNRI